jgi:hypothetical protein
MDRVLGGVGTHCHGATGNLRDLYGSQRSSKQTRSAS